MATQKKKSLGKGLGALIGASDPIAQFDPVPLNNTPETLPDGTRLVMINPRSVHNNPRQPRRQFDEEQLQELAQSIRNDGVLEPVIVRKRDDGEYELVSGERRVRASVLAELDEIPSICRTVSDNDMLRLGIIENVQREDLNAIELGLAYAELIQELNCTQDELSDIVGKKRATIANTIRLLQLPEVIQQHVVDGAITMGHARALLAIDSEARQRAICRKIIENDLSVRDAERAAQPEKSRSESSAKSPDPHVAAVEDELRKLLGTRVRLKSDANHRGKIEIDFFNLDDLDRILDLLRS
ncbi:MAG: ParB/RepB/Spo0J family partition protein [Candidatus Hydrogenedentota bacterium]